jgi:DNA-binding CsgD family transcriptional regulator
VEGEVGLGKTRFLDEIAQMARRQKMSVGSAVADLREALLDLSAVTRALPSAAGSKQAGSATEAVGNASGQYYWSLESIHNRLERAASNVPIVIIVDDLQWADMGTILGLRHLPAWLARVQVGWVVAINRAPEREELQAALRHLEHMGANRISLERLDQTAAVEIAQDLVQGDLDGNLLEAINGAGGSPLLLVELLSGLREEQCLQVQGGRARLVDVRLPERIRKRMSVQLGRLSEPARHLALVAASVGRLFRVNDVAAILERPPSALLAPVAELVEAKVFCEVDDKLGFADQISHAAVRESIPMSFRRALDCQTASTLLNRGVLPVEVARNLLKAVEVGDDAAIALLLNASRVVGLTDPAMAADLAKQAIEISSLAYPLRGTLIATTARWLHASGRGPDATSLVEAGIRQGLGPEQEAEARLSVSEMYTVGPDARHESSSRALSLPGLSRELRQRHSALLALNLVAAGRRKEAEMLLGSMESDQDRWDPRSQAGLALARSGLRYAGGQFGKALELADVALRSSECAECAAFTVAREWRCEILMALGRWEEAEQISAAGVAEAKDRRQTSMVELFEMVKGRLLLERGLLVEANGILNRYISPGSGQRPETAMQAAALVGSGRIALHLGDQVSLRKAKELAVAMINKGAPSVRRHALWLLSLVAMGDEEPSRAHEWLCKGGEELMSVLPRFPMDVTDEVHLTRLALQVEDHELADQAQRLAAGRQELNPEVSVLRAVAAHTAGLVNRSLTELGHAVELLEGESRPLSLANALEDYGELAIDSGLTSEGVSALGRALVLVTNSGATRDSARVRGRLRALGVRRRLVEQCRPTTGWEGLTSAEMEVALVIAEGCTNRAAANRLFVSHHTVSGHLRSIYRKLNVNSRVELTLAVGLQQQFSNDSISA